MGLDMYLGKINKKVTEDKELEMLCSINYSKDKILDGAKLLEQNNIDELVKIKFIESFYNDYINLKDAPEEVLNEPYVREYCFNVKETNRDRLLYLLETINKHCIDINKKYNYYIENKDKIKTLEITELGYFRKHSDLHGYFENLYTKRGGTEEFNCVKIILTEEDIENVIKIATDELNGEHAVEQASGFFWGSSTIEDWKETKETFEKILKETDFENETVYYDSWW